MPGMVTPLTPTLGRQRQASQGYIVQSGSPTATSDRDMGTSPQMAGLPCVERRTRGRRKSGQRHMPNLWSARFDSESELTEGQLFPGLARFPRIWVW